MNPEQQRIAIAEACGWTVHDEAVLFGRHRDGCHSATIPDYLNDLNAMHEAEKLLPNTPNCRWRAELEGVCGTMGNMLRATAAHRAEAFLRTLGKWKED